MRIHLATVLLAGLLTPPPAAAVSPAPPASPSVPATATAVQLPHVMLIVEENREENDVLGSSSAPYVNQLAQQYGVATTAYAASHPSLPNYLELLSGSTWGVQDDGTGYSFSGATLADQLTAAGVPWRAYMESMPAACYTGASSGDYAKKHDPFMYFTSVTGSGECQNVVPFSGFSRDLASASPPAFVWVTPNLCDDGHDCSTQTMDSWLASHLPAVLQSRWFADDGTVIITWDEGATDAGCCNGAHGGHIATVVVASGARGHAAQASAVDHAGILRTIEATYGLSYLRDAACACAGDLQALMAAAAPASPPGATWLSIPHLR